MSTLSNPAGNPVLALEHIRLLLETQEVERDLVQRSAGARHELQAELLQRQQHSTLWREVNRLHPADIAYVLENLPTDERELLWQQVSTRRIGSVLLEVSDAVRPQLLGWLDRQRVLHAAEHMDSDDLADLVPDLPPEVVPSLMDRLEPEDRQAVQSVLSYPEDSVGGLMELDVLAIRADVSLDVVLRWLRRGRALEPGIDMLPVVDRDGVLQGGLHLHSLLSHPGETLVSDCMRRDIVSFHASDPASEAASAFERYDLIAAPVTNLHGTLLGLIKVEAVLDHIQATGQRELLSQAGLRDEEDLYAPVWKSARNRGLWLALNLVTAFTASRVIGAFEPVIAQIVALATLMPIVAAVGGNTGNQTLAMVIRGYAVGKIDRAMFRRLILKEIGVGCVNGIIWGGIMATATFVLYQRLTLALIMFGAMVANLTLATLVGVLTPTLLRWLGHDPAYGSSILLTGMTDSFGYFAFLGLATIFLGH